MKADQYPDKGLKGLLADWQAWSLRDTYTAGAKHAEEMGKGEAAAILRRGVDDQPQVSALGALRANEELCRLLTGWRWIAMRDAREHGASWQDIGDALGISKQAAQQSYAKTLDGQEEHCQRWMKPGEIEGYRALLDDSEPPEVSRTATHPEHRREMQQPEASD